MDARESPAVRTMALLAVLVVLAVPLVVGRPRVPLLPLAAGVALGALVATPPVSRRLGRRVDPAGDGSDRPWYHHVAVADSGTLGGQFLLCALPAGVSLAWVVTGTVGTATVGLLGRTVT